MNPRVSCIKQKLSKYLLEQLIGFNCKSEWAQSEKSALHSPMRDFPENCLLLIRNTEYYLCKKRKARNYQDKYIFDITLVNGLMAGNRGEGKGDISCLVRQMFLHYFPARKVHSLFQETVDYILKLRRYKKF